MIYLILAALISFLITFKAVEAYEQAGNDLNFTEMFISILFAGFMFLAPLYILASLNIIK